jgi:iron complex transport system permease protein
VLALLVPLAVLVAVAVGSVTVPLPAVTGALLGWLPGLGGEPTAIERAIVVHLRLPRVLLAAVVGGGLAMSGAALQGLFRNPMAYPGIIGVSSGAAFGAVVAVTTGIAAEQPWSLPLLAFGGALGATTLIYRLSTRHGRTPLAALLLAGLAVTAFLSAMTSFLLSLAQNVFVLRELVFWLLGGLEGRGWPHLRLAALPALLGCAALVVFARDLNVVTASGEEGAASLGVSIEWLKRWLLALTALVTGAVVSVSGIVGFVGLLVPHAVRLVVGPDHRVVLPASFLAGASFLILADLAARTLVPAEELRLGVVTAAIGAPCFVVLLERHRARVERL